MLQRSPSRRGSFNGTRVMAALALLFSFLAFLMAGAVLLRTGPEGGGAKANLQAFGEEVSEVFAKLRERIAGGGGGAGTAPGTPYSGESDRSAASRTTGGADSGAGMSDETDHSAPEADGAASDAAGGDADDSGIEFDAIKQRVDEIQDKVLADDKTAGDFIDTLKNDLANLRDRTKKGGGPLLDDIGQALTEARKSLAEDSAEAARRLRELSDDLVRRSREQTQRLMQEREEGAGEAEDGERF